MIIYKCDLCKKETNKIDSLILYKHTVDYCSDCIQKAKVIRRAMKHSIDFYRAEANKNIEESEEKILDKYVRNRTKRNNKTK